MSGFDLGLQIAAGMFIFFLCAPIVMWVVSVVFLLVYSLISAVLKGLASTIKSIFGRV